MALQEPGRRSLCACRAARSSRQDPAVPRRCVASRPRLDWSRREGISPGSDSLHLEGSTMRAITSIERTVCCFATVVVLAAAASAGAVTNGDFETGTLAGWSPIGASHAETAAVGVTPTQGTYQAYID